MLIPRLSAATAGADAGKFTVAGPVYLEIQSEASRSTSIVVLADDFKSALKSLRAFVGPFGLHQVDSAAAYLDAGAATVLFAVDSSIDPSEMSAALSGLPRHRVGVLTAAVPSIEAVETLGAELLSRAGHVWFQAGAAEDLPSSSVLTDVKKALGPEVAMALMLPPSLETPITPDAVGRLHAAGCSVVGAAAIAPSAEESAALAASGRQPLDIGSCFAACARSDRPDGLFATVVADECGKALGLVYSSSESIAEAVRCGRGVYYSRSRGGLWRKGDSSGAVQELVHMALDCDSDALLFTVRQRGAPPAFCHLNTRTCWGEDGGLTALQRVLESRRASAPAGSYTKRLFDDSALLRHKLLEEAQELAEAAEPDHVAAEAADLIYFAMVAAVRAGVGLGEVEAHLDRRALKLTRRPGNAKAERIKAAEEHFAGAAGAGAAQAATDGAAAGAPAV